MKTLEMNALENIQGGTGCRHSCHGGGGFGLGILVGVAVSLGCLLNVGIVAGVSLSYSGHKSCGRGC
jgi:hypothetical protein